MLELNSRFILVLRNVVPDFIIIKMTKCVNCFTKIVQGIAFNVYAHCEQIPSSSSPTLHTTRSFGHNHNGRGHQSYGREKNIELLLPISTLILFTAHTHNREDNSTATENDWPFIHRALSHQSVSVCFSLHSQSIKLAIETLSC